MDSSEPEERQNSTAPMEEDTVALNKKRGRRVSFAAEMTSVRVFDRDEEYDTPPESKPVTDMHDEVIGFFSELQNGEPDESDDVADDDDGEEEEEVMDGRRHFFQPYESPSSGTFGFGSASSNDGGDEFFGPLSVEFLRHGRLSDSMATNDTPELTMDSTAFSLQFQSLARSLSGDLRTPTGSHILIEGKTPTQTSTDIKPGSSMELTGFSKPVRHTIPLVDSGGEDSNDMSLVGCNPSKYDYANISPRLDKFLSGEMKSLNGVSVSDFSDVLKSRSSLRNKSDSMSSQCDTDPLKHVQHTELRNPNACDSSAAFDIVRGKQTGGSASFVHDMDCRSALGHDQADKFATEIKDQMLSQHDRVREISHTELPIQCVSNGTPTKSSSPVPSGRLPDHEELQHPPQGDVFEQNIITQMNIDFQKGHSLLSGSPRPLALTEQPEIKHKERLIASDAVHVKDICNQSPSVANLSTENAIQTPLIMEEVNSSKEFGVISSGKLLNFVVEREGTGANATCSSGQDSMGNLTPLGVSSLSCTPIGGDSSLRSKLSSCIVETPCVEMPMSRSEDKFSVNDQQKSAQRMTEDIDGNGFITPKAQEKADTVSHVSRFVEEGSCDLSSLQNISEEVVMKSGNGSSLMKTLNSFVRTPDKIVHSHSQRLITGVPARHDDNSPKKFSSSVDAIDKQSSVVKSHLIRYEELQDHHGGSSNQTRKDGDSTEVHPIGNFLKVVGQNLDNFFMEENMYSRSPFLVIDQVKSPLQATVLLNGVPNPLDLHKAGKFQTPLKNGPVLNGGLFTPRHDMRNRLSEGGNIGSAGFYVPSHEHPIMDESPRLKVRSTTGVSSHASIDDASEKDVMHVGKLNSSVHKRRHDDIRPGNEEPTHVDHITKVQKVELRESVKQSSISDIWSLDQSANGSIEASRRWSAMVSEVIADSEQLRLVSVDKIDLRKIEKLEDMLDQFQKVHNIGRIYSSIQYQNRSNHISLGKKRSIFEMTELLQKVLYEQANLKLMCAKRDRLMRRVEIINSGIQGCQTVKLNCPKLLEHLRSNTVGRSSYSQAVTAPVEGHQNLQVADEVLKLRQKVIASQRDIDSLIYSFKKCFRMKEYSSSFDTIESISNHLKRRSLLKSLREDLQLWEIDDVVYKKGQNQIILNYGDLLVQRFTLVACVSTVMVYLLCHHNIQKKFPNVDASVAFSSVFKVDIEQKYVGIRSLAQETQVTSSVLSSLLDVIEEVILAKLELMNLIEAKFFSPSAEKLDLHLCFLNLKTGLKVNMTLDISCLNRGIYPSEALPSELQAHRLQTVSSLPAELHAEVDSTKFGFSRILRLCRTVSGALSR